MPINKLFSSW